MLNPTTILGLAAAACTTLAFLPQVIKNWKTRSVDDLSFVTYTLMTVGTILWLSYGLLIGNAPIIVANSITLCLTSANIIQILYYRARGERQKN